MAERDTFHTSPAATDLLQTGNNARLSSLLRLVIDDLDQCLRDRQSGLPMDVLPEAVQPMAPRTPR